MDMKKKAKELLSWIDSKEHELENPVIIDFGKNIKEVEDNEDKLQDYKKGEKTRQNKR